MSYVISIEKKAQKALLAIPLATRQRIITAIESLADNPYSGDTKKLQDEDNLWRLRVGDYRVLYQIFQSQLVVLVLEIGTRGQIYKKK